MEPRLTYARSGSPDGDTISCFTQDFPHIAEIFGLGENGRYATGEIVYL